jgi:hypothetical protein
VAASGGDSAFRDSKATIGPSPHFHQLCVGTSADVKVRSADRRTVFSIRKSNGNASTRVLEKSLVATENTTDREVVFSRSERYALDNGHYSIIVVLVSGKTNHSRHGGDLDCYQNRSPSSGLIYFICTLVRADRSTSEVPERRQADGVLD